MSVADTVVNQDYPATLGICFVYLHSLNVVTL